MLITQVKASLVWHEGYRAYHIEYHVQHGNGDQTRLSNLVEEDHIKTIYDKVMDTMKAELLKGLKQYEGEAV